MSSDFHFSLGQDAIANFDQQSYNVSEGTGAGMVTVCVNLLPLGEFSEVSVNLTTESASATSECSKCCVLSCLHTHAILSLVT